MYPLPRDLQIITHISDFQLVSSGQLQSIFFHANRSPTAFRNVMKRLDERGFVMTLSQTVSNSPHGGGAQKVFYLGPEGWSLTGHTERYQRRSKVNYYKLLHTLAIGDVYANVRKYEREGRLILDAYATEPDCHQYIDGIELEPDITLTLRRPGAEASAEFWLEVDMDSQGERRIGEKMDRYVKASRGKTVFPFVVFVTTSEHRQAAIEGYIRKRPPSEQRIFRVSTVDKFPFNIN